MRTILFRAKLVNHDDWIFGQYYRSYYDNDGEKGYTHCISNEKGAYSVQPETVGQFTGLRDKNGVKIFEGDVLRIDAFKGIVTYSEQHCQWLVSGIAISFFRKEIEVIGNIHDK